MKTGIIHIHFRPAPFKYQRVEAKIPSEDPNPPFYEASSESPAVDYHLALLYLKAQGCNYVNGDPNVDEFVRQGGRIHPTPEEKKKIQESALAFGWISKEDTQSLPEALRNGASADIWFDAHEYPGEEAKEKTIEITQEAMTTAADRLEAAQKSLQSAAEALAETHPNLAETLQKEAKALLE